MKIKYKQKEGEPLRAKIEIETAADKRKLEIVVGLCNLLSPVKMEELAKQHNVTI